MAHHTNLKSGYKRLVDRLNRYPQGAAETDTLYKILRVLFSEHEADLVAGLPIKPFTVEKAAALWKLAPDAARAQLETLAERNLLVDLPGRHGETRYVLPPPVVGFFEFSLMRVRNDIDQKALSELYHQYMNVEDDFVKKLFGEGVTRFGRIFVGEDLLSDDNALHVLDYERATHVVRTSRAIAVGLCYCRHMAEHLGRDCDAPKSICMSFNGSARILQKRGLANSISKEECLDLLDQARGSNLVQFGENAQQDVGFICNCCGCCCEALSAACRFGLMHPIHTTNFQPKVDAAKCTGCGKCVKTCPVDALSLADADASKPRRKAELTPGQCLGCGVCVRACGKGALSLEARPERVITPVNMLHRLVLMAIERGTLQHLIFDNHESYGHRGLAAVLGVILKLPPVKRHLAEKQLHSRYVTNLLSRAKM